MRAQPIALMLLLASQAAAQETPQVPVRVESRFVRKQGRVGVDAAFVYLERGDFYRNPGFQLTMAYWAREAIAAELQFGAYDAIETDALAQVRHDTGFLPDSRHEAQTLTAGARWAFAYGKALLGSETLVRFDPQLFAHVGMHRADEMTGFMSDFGLALAARPWRRVSIRLDVALVVQSEQRSGVSVGVFGFKPSLGFGVLL